MLLKGEAKRIWSNVGQALAGIAEAGSLSEEERTALQDALTYLQALQQVQRLAVGSEMTADAIPDGLKDRLCRAVHEDDFGALERHLAALKSGVHAIAAEKLQLPATD